MKAKKFYQYETTHLVWNMGGKSAGSMPDLEPPYDNPEWELIKVIRSKEYRPGSGHDFYAQIEILCMWRRFRPAEWHFWKLVWMRQEGYKVKDKQLQHMMDEAQADG